MGKNLLLDKLERACNKHATLCQILGTGNDMTLKCEDRIMQIEELLAKKEKHEMLDWETKPKVYEKLPKDLKEKIKAKSV